VWKRISYTLYWPGAALFFLLTVPWFWAVCRANDDFFYFFFVQEHFLRYATRMHGRYEPFWFFIPVLIGGLTPWTGLLPDMLKEAFFSDKAARRPERDTDAQEKFARYKRPERSGENPSLFLGLWFLVPFVFFSLSNSKLIPYILPCLPPLAVLGGRVLSLIAEGEDEGVRATRFVLLNGIVLSLLAAAGVVYPVLEKKLGAAALYPYTLPATASLLALLFCEWQFYSRRAYEKMIEALCVLAFINAVVFSRGVALKTELDSYKESAAVIRALRTPSGDVIVGYKEIAQGLGFYLERRLVLAEVQGELQFGASQEKDPRWFIDAKALEVLWKGETRVFLATDARNEAELERLLGKSNIIKKNRFRNNVVLSNF
jgi:4-amino-4-deoxy-L-arabinose transferase-like glycosyltransferase